MTDQQKSSCDFIIHSSAAAAGCGSMISLSGAGFASDVVAMTAMTMGLTSVFGGNLTEEMAKGIAITVLKGNISE